MTSTRNGAITRPECRNASPPLTKMPLSTPSRKLRSLTRVDSMSAHRIALGAAPGLDGAGAYWTLLRSYWTVVEPRPMDWLWMKRTSQPLERS